MTVVTRGQRYDVRAYYALAKAGVLTPEDRVELIEGEIIPMAPIGSQHAGTVVTLGHRLTLQLGERALVSVQNPLRLDNWSEPVPDVVILRRRADNYRRAHPGPADALLVIEVADTTVSYDRGRKAPLYARFGIQELWLVLLQRERIEVYRDPIDGRYASMTILSRGQSLSPAAFPDITLTVDEILG